MTPSAAVGARHIEFGCTPRDIALVRTRDELRGVLLDDLLSGQAAWLSMEGLDLAAGKAHSRLLRTAARFRRGLAGLNGNPHTAIFDWSTSRRTSIDSLAAFPVFASAVGRLGATIVCCEPRDMRVTKVLAASGLVQRVGMRWVGEETVWSFPGLRHVSTMRLSGARGTLRLIPVAPMQAMHSPPQLMAPVLVACPDDGAKVSERFAAVCRAAGDESAAHGASERVAMAIGGIAIEVASNALRHAQATCVSIAVGIHHEPAPRIEMAISDDGIGIAAQIRRKPGVRLLDRVPERFFVADLLRGVHDREAARKGPGRGLVHGLRKLLVESEALVVFRSGGVLAEVTRAGSKYWVVSSSSNGMGTTVRISIPLPSRRARWR